MGAAITPRWNDTPAVRALLASATPEDFTVYKTRGLTDGFDRLSFGGLVAARLEDLRRELIVTLFGCDFGTAYDAGRVDELFAFEEAQPSIDDAIAQHFGADLWGCNRWDMDAATRQWRAMASANLAMRVAA